eukprot:scaffold309676_cov83-Cyclotella_meneghiniana.AAC.1
MGSIMLPLPIREDYNTAILPDRRFVLDRRVNRDVDCGIPHTNDLDYPSSWNTLPNEDKATLFYASYTDCCMDHFRETSECNIVDHCSGDTNEDDASIAVVSTTRRNQDYSTKDVAIIQPDQEPTSLSSSCSQWRPSGDQPGTCTNSQADV